MPGAWDRRISVICLLDNTVSLKNTTSAVFWECMIKLHRKSADSISLTRETVRDTKLPFLMPFTCMFIELNFHTPRADPGFQARGIKCINLGVPFADFTIFFLKYPEKYPHEIKSMYPLLKAMWIQICWLLLKPADQNPLFFILNNEIAWI